jgi:hypothetical protein
MRVISILDIWRMVLLHNTRTHNHSPHYSLLIMRGSTFREILVSLQKRLLIVTDQNHRLILWIFSFQLKRLYRNISAPNILKIIPCLLQIHLRAVIWLTINKVVLNCQSIWKRPRYYQDFSASWVPADEWREIRA